MGRAFMHGWISLPSQGELYLEHGIPREVRVADALPVDVERLLDEVDDVTGLHVTLGHWQADEETGELEATVQVHAEDVTEVLLRLAKASAENYYDRYHRMMDASDIDYDDEAYAEDMNHALEVCGLRWNQLEDAALKRAYRQALHRAVEDIGKDSG